MKVFSTKYALSTGIQEVEGEICTAVNPDMFEVSMVDGKLTHYRYCLHGEGKEWHRTEQAAVERAIVMVEKKVISIQKSLRKVNESGTKFRDRLNILKNH